MTQTAEVLRLPVAPPDFVALEHAWDALPASEDDVAGSLGEDLGDRLLALWALSRLGPEEAEPLARPARSGAGRSGAARSLLRDMMQMAFALGAGWQARRECSP